MTRPVRSWRRRGLAVLGAAALGAALLPAAAASAQTDPRVGLTPGFEPWSSAASGMELLANLPKPTGFRSAEPAIAAISTANSDLALQGDYAYVGNYAGLQVFDVSNPSAPRLATTVSCPGGQGDVSVYGDLLFFSVEEARGRLDCTAGTTTLATADPERFRGVRIFDVSDPLAPRQVGGVQTCRGSHTHTLVTQPGVTNRVWIYNSGTSGVRLGDELAGCKPADTNTQEPVTDPEVTPWSIDVIEVPLANPAGARIVDSPRIFQDETTGALNGLTNTPAIPASQGGTPRPNAVEKGQPGATYSPVPNTNTCHDITAYPAIGLAAGACQGDGLLLDISNAANPVRIDAVSDVNFAYWHSATFNNDGTKVVFTDEWGGGTGARCQATDPKEWGANALFDIVDGKLEFRSYYKLPAPQSSTENCVAHNGSLVPVPGRDILVQAWYQGGSSVIDFTDTANPREIAFFDRGPASTGPGVGLAGYWSTYWYDGTIKGTEIARGFDVLDLTATPQMTARELAAAKEVRQTRLNAQSQEPYAHAPSFDVAGALVDQAARAGTLAGSDLRQVNDRLAQAQKLRDGRANARAVKAQLDTAARTAGRGGNTAVVTAIQQLAATL